MADLIQPGELRVDPVRIINILKARLVEEQARSAMFEAAYQEAKEHEQALATALSEQGKKVIPAVVNPA